MLGGSKLRELRSYLARPADVMPVRAMALICFGAATLLLLGMLLNHTNLPVSDERRLVSAAVVSAAGVIYWVFARRFRIWMLHLIITVGVAAGSYGLAQMDTSIGAAMAILTILWTCLLIGSIFRPPVARVYGAISFIGIALGLSWSTATAGENIVLAVSFGLTIIVTVELLSRTSSQLRDDAIRDPLTGLLNRKGLEEAAAQAVRSSIRNNEPLAIVSFDLNEFKQINDRQGHFAGDQELIRCAEIWSAQIRPQDVLARYGGDEFVLLLPGADREQAEVAMRRLADDSPLSFAQGIAIALPGDPIEAKLNEADSELIRAKSRLRQDHTAASSTRP